jgi:hypothetical protein
MWLMLDSIDRFIGWLIAIALFGIPFIAIGLFIEGRIRSRWPSLSDIAKQAVSSCLAFLVIVPISIFLMISVFGYYGEGMEPRASDAFERLSPFDINTWRELGDKAAYWLAIIINIFSIPTALRQTKHWASRHRSNDGVPQNDQKQS